MRLQFSCIVFPLFCSILYSLFVWVGHGLQVWKCQSRKRNGPMAQSSVQNHPMAPGLQTLIYLMALLQLKEESEEGREQSKYTQIPLIYTIFLAWTQDQTPLNSHDQSGGFDMFRLISSRFFSDVLCTTTCRAKNTTVSAAATVSSISAGWNGTSTGKC